MAFRNQRHGLVTITGSAIVFSITAWAHPALPFSLVPAPDTDEAYNPVSEIRNLSIGGQLYNVRVRAGATFDGLFGPATALKKTPTFWLNPAGAAEAAQAVITALGTSSYIDSYTFEDTTTYFDNFLVPYDFTVSEAPWGQKIVVSVYNDQDARPEVDVLAATFAEAGPDMFADFWGYATFELVEPQAVPEPFMGGAILGLSSLALFARRKKKSVSGLVNSGSSGRHSPLEEPVN